MSNIDLRTLLSSRISKVGCDFWGPPGPLELALNIPSYIGIIFQKVLMDQVVFIELVYPWFERRTFMSHAV